MPLALVVLGGRQLGLGILMHEAAHRSLFKSQVLNEWIGQWLCAAPMFVELAIYRRYHMTHHIKAGTIDDPDLPNYEHYRACTGLPAVARGLADDLHAVQPDPQRGRTWRNTRTALAAWWERLTVAPNYVNYHFVHHLARMVGED